MTSLALSSVRSEITLPAESQLYGVAAFDHCVVLLRVVLLHPSILLAVCLCNADPCSEIFVLARW